MKRHSALPMILLVVLGYVLLVGAIMIYLQPPWNWAVASLVLFKGLVYWAIMGKVARIGRMGRPKPPPE